MAVKSEHDACIYYAIMATPTKSKLEVLKEQRDELNKEINSEQFIDDLRFLCLQNVHVTPRNTLYFDTSHGFANWSVDTIKYVIQSLQQNISQSARKFENLATLQKAYKQLSQADI